MLNRWWLPKGTPADYLVSLSFIDLEGVEPRLLCHILLITSSPIHHFILSLYSVLSIHITHELYQSDIPHRFPPSQQCAGHQPGSCRRPVPLHLGIRQGERGSPVPYRWHGRPRAYVGAVACFAFAFFFHARPEAFRWRLHALECRQVSEIRRLGKVILRRYGFNVREGRSDAVHHEPKRAS